MTDARREIIPLLWRTVGKTALAKGFCSDIRVTKYITELGRQLRELGRNVHVVVLFYLSSSSS